MLNRPTFMTDAAHFATQSLPVRVFCLGCLLLASAQMAAMIVLAITQPF